MEDLDFGGAFVVPGRTPVSTWQEHVGRYAFAKRYAAGKTVLDVACGTGYGSDMLVHEGASQVVGGDVDVRPLNWGAAHYPNPRLSFVGINAQEMGFPNDTFDLVVSFETVEHLPDHEAFLSEVQRILKPGGLFICSTPNKAYFSPCGAKALNPYHVHEFRREEFYGVVTEHFDESEYYFQRVSGWIPALLNYCIRLCFTCLRYVPFGQRIQNRLWHAKATIERSGAAATADYAIHTNQLDESFAVQAGRGRDRRSHYFLVVAKSPTEKKILDDLSTKTRSEGNR